jgi:hypothetical protein
MVALLRPLVGVLGTSLFLGSAATIIPEGFQANLVTDRFSETLL